MYACLFVSAKNYVIESYLLTNNRNRMERLRRLERIRWEVGVVIPQDLKVNPNTHEMNFFSGYDKLLGGYMRSLRGLDLTAVISNPI
jgi:hypothetical protein